GEAAGRHSDCLAFLRPACEKYPDALWLRWDMFTTCRQHDPPLIGEALQHAAAMPVIRPNSAFCHNTLGWAQTLARQPGAAVRSFRRAIELNPRFTSSHWNLGRLLAD